MSKLTFRNVRDYNSAALSIQKKYRGWKSRKDYLAFRKKVVKIQAHVMGYQVRKNYEVICWAVGVLDKVILRWRRKGVGLRGFQQETQSSIDDSEDEDIAKVFRKEKVDGTIDEAVWAWLILQMHTNNIVACLKDTNKLRLNLEQQQQQHRYREVTLSIWIMMIRTY